MRKDTGRRAFEGLGGTVQNRGIWVQWFWGQSVPCTVDDRIGGSNVKALKSLVLAGFRGFSLRLSIDICCQVAYRLMRVHVPHFQELPSLFLPATIDERGARDRIETIVKYDLIQRNFNLEYLFKHVMKDDLRVVSTLEINLRAWSAAITAIIFEYGQPSIVRQLATQSLARNSLRGMLSASIATNAMGIMYGASLSQLYADFPTEKPPFPSTINADLAVGNFIFLDSNDHALASGQRTNVRLDLLQLHTISSDFHLGVCPSKEDDISILV